MRKWYEFKAQAEPGTAELHIFDAIARSDPWGDGLITSKQFVRDLAALGSDVKAIRVHINSPGGDAFAAIAIANALREQRVAKGRTVETIVDGMAASAASLILMAGSPIKISDNAMVMIHNPRTVAMGNAADLLKVAADLESIKGALVATYRWHSQLDEGEIGALMDAETWMDAEEALANGFADEIVPGLQAQASIDPAAVARLQVPERFSARVAALARREEQRPEPPAPPQAAATLDEIAALCEPAGLGLAFARALASERPSTEQAAARIAAERARLAAEAQRQADIRALCDLGKVPLLADELVASGASLEGARAIVARVTGMVDRVELDAGLVPGKDGALSKASIDYAGIYAARNKRG